VLTSYKLSNLTYGLAHNPRKADWDEPRTLNLAEFLTSQNQENYLPMKHTSLLLTACCCFLQLFAIAQDPDIEANEAARLEEIFRTSDQAGETPTNRRQRDKKVKRVSVPNGAFRIGCHCMDGSYSDTRSIGACAGHGGVRFWVYRTREGDTVHVLTARHETHPQPLDAAEMSELSQKRADRTQNLSKPLMPMPYSGTQTPVLLMPESEGFDWPDAAALSAAGIALYFIVRLILRWLKDNERLVRYALRNLLRHRKRPPTRPRSQNPRKKRLP